ncbi:MAG: hypothetical protein ACM3VZ_14535 [Acidobacteriota bacterium]
MNKRLPIIVLSVFASFHIAAACAETAAIYWTAKSEHTLVVNNIVTIAPGTYCLAGADLDTVSAHTHAVIQQLDASRNSPVWITDVPPSEKEFFQNRFTSCAIMGDSIYGLEEVDTQPSSTTSQTLLFVNRFDKQGRRTARKQVSIAAKKPWTIGFAAMGESLYALVGEQESKAKTPGGMHLISMSSDLDVQRAISIPNGAFFYPSKMLTTEQGILLVGPFAKNAQEQDAELAAAKLSPNGKYLWAQHIPYPASKATYTMNPDTQEIRVSVIQNGELQSQAVNAAGRISVAINVKSTACRALGHAGSPDSPQILALSCDKPPQLVATSLSTGLTTPIKKLDQKPLKSFDLTESALIVMRSGNDTPEYQFLQIKK